MKKSIILISIILLPSFVVAEPTYLDCYVFRNSGGAKKSFTLTLNEDHNKAIHSWESGVTREFKALYKSNIITLVRRRYESTPVSTIHTVTYKIDRTTLSIKERIHVESDRETFFELSGEGECKIQKAAKNRKI